MVIVTSFDFDVIGIVNVTVRESDGTIVSQQTYHNKETNYMKQTLTKWLYGYSNTSNAGFNVQLPPTMIGAGTGTGTVSATDTALWQPLPGTLKNCDQILFTRGIYAQYNLTYQQSDPSATYTELGLFDTNNNLWAHVSINQTKTSSQTLTVQWMIYVVPINNLNATITNYAISAFAQWMTGTPNVAGQPNAVIPPSMMILGTGTTPVTVNDTALANPTTGTRYPCDYIAIQNGTTIQFAKTYQTTDPAGTFTEVGWIDSNNNLWARGSINATKSSNNLLSVVGQINIVGD